MGITTIMQLIEKKGLGRISQAFLYSFELIFPTKYVNEDGDTLFAVRGGIGTFLEDCTITLASTVLARMPEL